MVEWLVQKGDKLSRLVVVVDGVDITTTNFWHNDYKSKKELQDDVIDCIEFISKKINKKWWQFWI